MSRIELPRELLDEVANCALELALEPTAAGRIKRDWYARMKARFGDDGASLAFNIMTIGLSRAETVVNNYGPTRFTAVDKSKQAGGNLTEVTQNAGRDMIGVVGGSENMVEFGDIAIANYGKMIDESPSVNDQLRAALKDGRRALEELKIEEDEKKEVLSQYLKLTEELKKQQPRKTMLQVCWGAVCAAGSALKPIVTLGGLLSKLYGLPAPPA